MTSAVHTYNFCSGPALLPEEVLQKAQSELLSYQGCGVQSCLCPIDPMPLLQY